jgi:acetyltransferase
MGAQFQSRRGRSLLVRPLEANDGAALVAMLTALSPATIYARYLMPLPGLSPAAAEREAQRLQALCAGGSLVLVASDETSGAIVAIAELARDSVHREQAEAALLVTDTYQREGVGRAVTDQLIEAAPGVGISSVAAMARYDNSAVHRLVRNLGLPYTAEMSQGMLRYVFS